MLKHKAESLALTVAASSILIMMVIFIIDLTLSHRQAMQEGQNRLQHFSLMMSEHTARSFEALDMLVREVSKDMSNNYRNWRDWDSATGWEYLARRQSGAMRQLRNLILFDNEGNQRFVSTALQPSRVNIIDRPYFTELRDGAAVSHYGPYRSRNTDTYTYAIARRLNDRNDQFAGALIATSEPGYFEEFCWPNRLSDDFEAVLTNRLGQIIASCRPIDLSKQSPILGRNVENILFSEQLTGHIPESGVERANGLLVARTAVPGFPDLYIIAAMPEETLFEGWRWRSYELASIALLVASVLLIGAWLIRRQVRAMSAITSTLENTQRQLEERIQLATQELASQKDMAERANIAKSRFLAAASHDLRQPLHALALFAADLQRQVRQEKLNDLPRIAQQIALSASTLSELLNALLDISRLDVNGIRPEIQAFPLTQLLSRLEESFSREATEHQIRLRFHKSTRIWLETDPALLERMLGNLIGNAIRYTPAGGSIMVGARRRGPRIAIEVRDSGIGISREHQHHVFGEFYQVENRARESNKGLGLGLSIVRRLARALDIEIVLNSRLGEGTSFQLLVRETEPRKAAAATPADEDGRPRVLGIGNSEELQECLGLLARWDYAVTHAATSDAIEQPLEAVIVADAEQAMRISAQIPADTPLVLICRDDSWETPPGAHILPVPVRPAKLRALVTQLQKTLSRSMP